jgi:hypothetical protein
MRKQSIVKYALLGFIICACALYANEDENAAENVLRRAYTSIARIEEGKIFLKPEKLHLNQGIIYIEDIDGGGFAIPVVFSSEVGPFMQVGESVIFNSWKCNCGVWNHKWDNPTQCWNCHKPR